MTMMVRICKSGWKVGVGTSTFWTFTTEPPMIYATISDLHSKFNYTRNPSLLSTFAAGTVLFRFDLVLIKIVSI
jgi:hypothetical protein